MPVIDYELENKKLEFDHEKWVSDERLRREELSLKREELARSRWINPLVIAIFAAAAAALGNAGVALINSTKQLQLEASRARLTRS
jgi:hypothetical protein